MPENRHGMDGRDLDFPAQGRRIEGILDILHRRDELVDQILVAGGHDLVADGDQDDLAGRVEGSHVGVDPIFGEIGVGGQRRDVAVGGADDDSDAGVGEGFDYGRVGSVQSDLLNGSRLE